MTAPAILVVDASIAVKWYVPEDGSRAAAELLDRGDVLVAPDLLAAELGNILWKKVRRGELTPDEATEMATAFVTHCPVRLRSSTLLLSAALEIAVRFDRTVYDALYVALAVAEDGRLVTGDERLCNTLQGTPLERFLQPLALP
jgi:predicted nucleic acid-binding protein